MNNYGRCRSNEELMMAHGFALENNPHDTFGLSLAVGRNPDTRMRLGPYYLHRAGHCDRGYVFECKFIYFIVNKKNPLIVSYYTYMLF